MNQRVLIVGVRASGEGYPNASNTIRVLQEHGVTEVVDLGYQFPGGIQLWKLSGQSKVRQLSWALRTVATTLASVSRLLLKVRLRTDWVYVPYPAIPAMLLLSLLPRSIRPRCIVDAYISIWDSAFADRGRSGRISGTITKIVERWALRAAHVVLVDTEASKDYFSQIFRLPLWRLRSAPLAIGSQPFREVRGYERADGEFRVVFMGTLIPLHGINVILEAARLLHDAPQIKFILIGDGQMGGEVARAMSEGRLANLIWHRQWLSLNEVAAALSQADICLGVFGGGAKASRVLPFKIYYALAAGRAVVSQRALSTPASVPSPPIRCVEIEGDVSCSARSLADEILHLSISPTLRGDIATSAAEYFDRFLSDSAVADFWRRSLASNWSV